MGWWKKFRFSQYRYESVHFERTVSYESFFRATRRLWTWKTTPKQSKTVDFGEIHNFEPFQLCTEEVMIYSPLKSKRSILILNSSIPIFTISWYILRVERGCPKPRFSWFPRSSETVFLCKLFSESRKSVIGVFSVSKPITIGQVMVPNWF